jgi:putative thioredoxin
MTIEVQNFDEEVIGRSREIPVVVDFWAEWCGPCRVLWPILERLAASEPDRWVLAKLNVDEQQEVAVRFGISGIPAVKMFIDGVPVGEFVGALPEHSVKQWLAKTLPGRHGSTIDQVKELISGGRNAEAEQSLRNVLVEEPENGEARVLLARIVVFKNPAEAEILVRDVFDPKANELAGAVRTLVHLSEIRQHPDQLPADAVREEYLGSIEQLFTGNYDGALAGFIDVIRSNRYYDDDGSRKACIAIFKYCGEENPVTVKHRKEFSGALY